MTEKAIAELETYFRSAELPKGSFSISEGETVNDVRKLLTSHFSVVKSNERIATPFWDRLVKLKAFMEKPLG